MATGKFLTLFGKFNLVWGPPMNLSDFGESPGQLRLRLLLPVELRFIALSR